MANLATIGAKVAARTADVLASSLAEGEAYARRIVTQLTLENYAESVELAYTPPAHADVYGVRNEDGCWYVKFYIEHGRLKITSCHPPVQSLKLRDGRWINTDD